MSIKFWMYCRIGQHIMPTNPHYILQWLIATMRHEVVYWAVLGDQHSQKAQFIYWRFPIFFFTINFTISNLFLKNFFPIVLRFFFMKKIKNKLFLKNIYFDLFSRTCQTIFFWFLFLEKTKFLLEKNCKKNYFFHYFETKNFIACFASLNSIYFYPWKSHICIGLWFWDHLLETQ